MKVEILTLCDFATTDAAGKLNILGSFDRMNVPQMPLVYPICALAMKLRFSEIETGQKRIRLSFMDADGNPVLPALDAQMNIAMPPGEPTATLPLVLIVPPIKLQRFGEYSIDLAVDGRQEASIPLYVRQAQAPRLPPQTPQAQE